MNHNSILFNYTDALSYPFAAVLQNNVGQNILRQIFRITRESEHRPISRDLNQDIDMKKIRAG
jgi:hypothetical protein